jgi:hypothetical protein
VSNFNRMATTFVGDTGTTSAPANWKQQPDGNWWLWDGSTWLLQPQGPPRVAQAVRPGSPPTAP